MVLIHQGGDVQRLNNVYVGKVVIFWTNANDLHVVHSSEIASAI